ncbi:replication protein A 70 kDa DNA-binding subunit C-like protein [Tanacetum coccineum]
MIIVTIRQIWDVNVVTSRYLSTDFVLYDAKPNNDEFRIIKNANFMLVEIDNLEPTNSKYLIDVVGYMTNVGRTVQQRTGSKTLDFYLANCRGQSVRVTLLGGLEETLIEKRMRHVDSIDGITIVSPLADRLYLSNSSSTLILDDDNIPELKQLKTDDSGVESSKETLPVDFGDKGRDP